jgi:hypothetical protein
MVTPARPSEKITVPFTFGPVKTAMALGIYIHFESSHMAMDAATATFIDRMTDH